MAAFDFAKIYSSVTQTVSDNTTTTLTFDSVETDPAGYRSGNTFVVPAGKGGVPFLLLGGTYSQSTKSAGVSAPTADLIGFFTINSTAPRGGHKTTTDPYQTSNPGQPVGYITWSYVGLLADADVVNSKIYIDNSGTSMVFGHASSIDAQTWMAIIRLAT